MIFELNHLGVAVHDLSASLNFYSEQFGAEEVFRGWIPSSRTEVVYIAVGQSLIELLHPLDPAADESFGLNHIAFMTNALDDDYERLLASGITGLSAPKPAGTGIGRLAFVESPGGVRVELIQRVLPLRAAGSSEADFGYTLRFAIESSVVHQEVEFFRDLVGMSEAAARSAQPQDASTTALTLNNDVLLLVERAQSAVPSALGGIAVSRRAPGSSLHVPPEDEAHLEGVRDPDGVAVMVD